MIAIERYAFCERDMQADCAIRTGEMWFYDSFAVRKSVVLPDAN
jgi:L-fucose mutarotase/ribose pyranase (RbsD/FucU family)